MRPVSSAAAAVLLAALSLSACSSADAPQPGLPPSSSPAQQSDLSPELKALVADLHTVKPAMEAYAKKKGFFGGGGPIDSEMVADGTLAKLDLQQAVAVTYSGGEGKLDRLEVSVDDLTAGLDAEGEYVVDGIESKTAPDPTFAKQMEKLQAAVEKYIAKYQAVPTLTRGMDGPWKLTKGFDGRGGEDVPLKFLPEELDFRGASSIGTEEWSYTLLLPSQGWLVKLSPDGPRYGARQYLDK